jgi:hypothetical protein
MNTNFVNPETLNTLAAHLYETGVAGAATVEDVKLSDAITNGDFYYLDIVLAGIAAIDTSETVDIDVSIWDCATTDGTYAEFKDFGTVVELTDAEDGAEYNTRVTGLIQGAKAFLKVGVQTAFSAANTDTNTYHAVAYKTKLTDIG